MTHGIDKIYTNFYSFILIIVVDDGLHARASLSTQLDETFKLHLINWVVDYLQ